MPQDPVSLSSPELLLASWSAGLALTSAVVALLRIVGPGFTWLAGSVAAVIAIPALIGPQPWWAGFGAATLSIGLVWARNRQMAGILQLFAGVALVIQASRTGAWLPATSGALALGGVSGEMMLGHWYLVDPRLPRWALRGLAGAGIGGLVADTAVAAVFGLPGGGATVVYWVLMVTSVVLMGAVLASLRQPAYSGVMAATGLSYLAVLTTLGGVFLGRVLLAGSGLFPG